jgi:hypothetical protein
MKKRREIKVTPNQSKRTFTIRCYYQDGTILKYRTNVMSREDFESCEYNTANDWENFLRYSYDYHTIK